MEARNHDHGIREAMGKNFQRCPKCDQVWLIFGMKEKESYICRTCGHAFIFGPEHSPGRLRAKLNTGKDNLNKAA